MLLVRSVQSYCCANFYWESKIRLVDCLLPTVMSVCAAGYWRTIMLPENTYNIFNLVPIHMKALELIWLI